MVNEPDARVGSQVGSYRLHEILGIGGMGIVYRGEHVYIGKQVAVKILHDRYAGKDEAVQRFLREARAASQINHPNIVDVTDYGEAPDGTVFFVMEYLRGDPLDAVLVRERRLTLLRSITILNQITRALGAAHGMGIVHRDLKPENIMLASRQGRRELIKNVDDGSGGARTMVERETTFDFVKILDFGVAKVRDPDMKARVTQAGVVFGTPEYMAPETARTGTADPRSDVYAVGIMFYEMLTGTVPFTGETSVDVMMKHVSEPVTPPRRVAPDAEITEEAERVILKALAKDPADRQQSMSELHGQLQGCYGTVRYRRASHVGTPPPVRTDVTARPIPLTQVKRPAPPPAVPPPPAAAPILLTRKKDPSVPARTPTLTGRAPLVDGPAAERDDAAGNLDPDARSARDDDAL